MTNFFVGIVVAAFKILIQDPTVQKWLQDLISSAVTTANADLKQDLTDMKNQVEQDLLDLPLKIVGIAEKTTNDLLHEVTGSTNDIANAVKGELGPLIPTADSLTSIFQGALKGFLPGGGTGGSGGGLLGGIFGR